MNLRHSLIVIGNGFLDLLWSLVGIVILLALAVGFGGWEMSKMRLVIALTLALLGGLCAGQSSDLWWSSWAFGFGCCTAWFLKPSTRYIDNLEIQVQRKHGGAHS